MYIITLKPLSKPGIFIIFYPFPTFVILFFKDLLCRAGPYCKALAIKTWRSAYAWVENV